MPRWSSGPRRARHEQRATLAHELPYSVDAVRGQRHTLRDNERLVGGEPGQAGRVHDVERRVRPR